MKHLKRFNESLSEPIEKLISEYLAYLKDAGFECNFLAKGVYYASRSVIKIDKNNRSGFYWEDIKYDLLPLIEVLDKSYEVKNILLYGDFTDTEYEVYIADHAQEYVSFGQNDKLSITDLINDKGIPNCELTTIEILFVTTY